MNLYDSTNFAIVSLLQVKKLEGMRLDSKTQKAAQAEIDTACYAIRELINAVKDNRLDGGPGSGNWGHIGIPGHWGGSQKGGGNAFRLAYTSYATKKTNYEHVEEEYTSQAKIRKQLHDDLVAAKITDSKEAVEKIQKRLSQINDRTKTAFSEEDLRKQGYTDEEIAKKFDVVHNVDKEASKHILETDNTNSTGTRAGGKYARGTAEGVKQTKVKKNSSSKKSEGEDKDKGKSEDKDKDKSESESEGDKDKSESEKTESEEKSAEAKSYDDYKAKASSANQKVTEAMAKYKQGELSREELVKAIGERNAITKGIIKSPSDIKDIDDANNYIKAQGHYDIIEGEKTNLAGCHTEAAKMVCEELDKFFAETDIKGVKACIRTCTNAKISPEAYDDIANALKLTNPWASDDLCKRTAKDGIPSVGKYTSGVCVATGNDTSAIFLNTTWYGSNYEKANALQEREKEGSLGKTAVHETVHAIANSVDGQNGDLVNNRSTFAKKINQSAKKAYSKETGEKCNVKEFRYGISTYATTSADEALADGVALGREKNSSQQAKAMYKAFIEQLKNAQ